MRAPIYLVGAYERPARTHCWGWYHTLEEAVSRMKQDKLFFEDRHYAYGLIEVYPYGDSLPTGAHWYKPVYESEAHKQHATVEPYGEPESAYRLVAFLMS